MPQISIIVPVYNVELYLQRCIDSILKQDFKDFELLLIDDGSTDKCSEICESYLQKDNRVKVIHKENGGLSSARNVGLEIAQGKYIGFVDSDDWISPYMYEKLYSFCEEEKLDMAICGVKQCYEEGKKETIYSKGKKRMIMDRKAALTELFVNSSFGEEAWNKLYRNHVFENIRYPEGKIHEDTFCICDIMEKCNKIGFTPETYYFYYQRSNSIMNSMKRIPTLDKIESVDLVLKHLKKFYPDIYYNSLYNLASAPLKNLEVVLDDQSPKVKVYQYKLKCFYRKYAIDVIKSQGFPIGTKLIMISLSISAGITHFLLKIKRKKI